MVTEQAPRRRRTLRRYLESTSRRTFVVFPLILILFELLVRGGSIAFEPWGALILAWGYLQYRLIRQYRLRLGGGGPGVDTLPERIVTGGPYRYTRNPIYLGQLIFMAGLAVTLRSWAALALFAVHVPWFHMHVLADEVQLEKRFGTEYLEYRNRVKRWLPGLL